MILHINKDNFEAEVLNSDKPVLIDFWAEWCGPCRMIGPIIEEIAEEREDVKVCKINIDDELELASRFQIVSIPTLVFMEGGEEVSRSIGARPKNQILSML